MTLSAASCQPSVTARNGSFANLAGGPREMVSEIAIAATLRCDLTDQELAVATSAALGLSTREAADLLHISPKTVEHHLSNIYRKLNVRSRSQLAATIIHRLLSWIGSSGCPKMVNPDCQFLSASGPASGNGTREQHYQGECLAWRAKGA
jgi:DNA-binding CsgD family transcriptional regulator